MDSVVVEIAKWTEYNPRSDIRRPSWYRVEYGLIENPDFYDFTHEEFKGLHYILSQACRKNSPTIRIVFSHANAVSKLSELGLMSAIKKLEAIKFLTLRERNGDVTHTNATDGTDGNERTDGTETSRPQTSNGLLLQSINSCVDEYRETLRHFKQGRTLLDTEKLAIGRAIQAHGEVAVKMALAGARCEPRSEKFNPADWVDLNRYLDPKNFKRFLGYGVKQSNMNPEGQ